MELFGKQAAQVRTEQRHFNFRYRSAAHWLQVFRDLHGPVHRALAAPGVAGPHSLVVPSKHLEIVITEH